METTLGLAGSPCGWAATCHEGKNNKIKLALATVAEERTSGEQNYRFHFRFTVPRRFHTLEAFCFVLFFPLTWFSHKTWAARTATGARCQGGEQWPTASRGFAFKVTSIEIYSRALIIYLSIYLFIYSSYFSSLQGRCSLDKEAFISWNIIRLQERNFLLG